MITSTHLRSPSGTGELTDAILQSLNPLATPEQTATTYAAVGNTKVVLWSTDLQVDLGARAWAHYRALSDRRQQILTGMISASSDEGARSYAVAQALELEKEADEWLALFNTLADELGPEQEVIRISTPPRSRSTFINVVW